MKKFLLDTHVFIWQAIGGQQLTSEAIKIIDSDAELLISYASIWEMAIKVSLNKLRFEIPFSQVIQEEVAVNEYVLLPMTLPHAFYLSQLPFYHKDPFDRLLIAQAKIEDIPIVSADTALDAYGVHRIW